MLILVIQYEFLLIVNILMLIHMHLAFLLEFFDSLVVVIYIFYVDKINVYNIITT